jgi:hypothetical protein
LHVPPLQKRHITNRRFAGFLPKAAGIDSAGIDDFAGHGSGTPVLVIHAVDIKHERGLPRYVLKGLAKEHAADLGIAAKPQGVVVGQRIGVAENIGPIEWKEWDFNWKFGGRDFALKRWREEAATPKHRNKPG